ADAGEHRPGGRHDGMEGQVVVKPDGIDRGVDPASGHQRWDGGSEPQTAVDVGQVEGLDPEPVPGEDDPARVPFREGEGEHAGEAADQALPPLMPALEEYLGVAGGEEAVPGTLEFPAQLPVVVDATVVHDGEAKLRVDHRLVAPAREVDDRQSPVPEGH